MYVSFASRDSAAALNGLQARLASVQSYMLMNKLKLNPDKTEFLLFRNEQQRSRHVSIFPVELFGVKTNPAKLFGIMGVIFDKKFTFRSHTSAVCSSGIYCIQQHVCFYLDLDTAKLLAKPLCLAISIIEIHLCSVLQTLTSANFNAFRIDWPAWW